jgi:DNA-binding IclR family transcriptional regulator
VKALLPYLRRARERGFSMIIEVFAPGMSAMSAPVLTREGKAIGVVTIAGPVFRLTENRMLALGPDLVATAAQIGDSSLGSPLLRNRG